MNDNGEDLEVVYSSGDIELSSNSLEFDEFDKYGTIDDFYGSLTIPSYKDKDAVEVINSCLNQLGLDDRVSLNDLRLKIKDTYY